MCVQCWRGRCRASPLSLLGVFCLRSRTANMFFLPKPKGYKQIPPSPTTPQKREQYYNHCVQLSHTQTSCCSALFYLFQPLTLQSDCSRHSVRTSFNQTPDKGEKVRCEEEGSGFATHFVTSDRTPTSGFSLNLLLCVRARPPVCTEKMFSFSLSLRLDSELHSCPDLSAVA